MQLRRAKHSPTARLAGAIEAYQLKNGNADQQPGSDV